MDDFSRFIVASYTTSPSLLEWNRQKEIDFMNLLKNTLNPIRGLELPFFGNGIHLHDESLFFTLLDSKWEYVLTCIPGNMQKLQSNIHFGLASDCENARIEAVEFYKKAFDTVKNINNYFNAKKVISIAIATSPSLNIEGVSSSVESLVKSLQELIVFDWNGANMVIEHCDSGRVKESLKGFLSLEEEIEAITLINKKHGTNIGITINWARSAIEFKDEHGANYHIEKAINKELLRGLMFSGTSSKESEYGIWSDLHMPTSKEYGVEYYHKDSLLNKKNIHKCLVQSNYDKLDYIGIKVLSMPISESSLDKRIGMNKDTLYVVNQSMLDIEVSSKKYNKKEKKHEI